MKRGCPIRRTDCDGRDFELITTHIREGEGRIVQCPRCDLVMQDLDWDANQIERYYNDDYQLSNSLVMGELQTARQHFDERIKTIQPVFDLVHPRINSGMSVLEIGCGAGELLLLIKPLVKRSVGVEMNRAFTDFIQSELGIDAYMGDITKMELKEKFDLVICVDSLDHMSNPLEALISMEKLINPGGGLWLMVPNLNDALRFFLPQPSLSQYREFFWHRAHFFYFDVTTMATMLRAAGLRTIETQYYHQYTFKNYLNWYFTGKPQRSYSEASNGVSLFANDDPFRCEINSLFGDMERQFHVALKRHGRGDTLCCYAVKNSA